MNKDELKDLMINSLNADSETVGAARKLEEEGVTFHFSAGFGARVLHKISSPAKRISRELEFLRYLNLAFYRVALTGVAAILILLLSIYLMEGSLSFNSFLGLSDSYDESIVCLLTGN
jgi:hypothetical protein